MAPQPPTTGSGAQKDLLGAAGELPRATPGFDARFIAELGVKAGAAQVLGLDLSSLEDDGLPKSLPLVWDPKAGQLVSLKTFAEAYRLRPREKAGSAVVYTLDSFITLTKRHQTAHSAVFANTDWRAPTFTSVIDYHPSETGGGADNGKHRVHYAFPLSEEWKAWVEMDGEFMDQMKFAIFLEDRIADLSSPTDAEKIALERDFATTVANPAQLIQLSRGLKVHVSSQVAAEHVLQSGAGEIKWSEQHQGSDGKPLVVPGMFLLDIAPFFMGEKSRIPVRLRYRVAGGKVLWMFQIYRPDVHVTERVQTDLDAVAKETGLPCFEGKPEMSA